MIVNTVSPESATVPNEIQDLAVAGRIGADADNPTSKESTQSQDIQPREEYSAKVELYLQLENGGSRIELAQTGPDFLILPSDHGHMVTAGTQGQLHVVVDGRCDPELIELIDDIDMSTTRVGYKRVDAELSAHGHATSTIAKLDKAIDKAEQERLFWEEVRLLGELRDNESQREKLNIELAVAKNRQRDLQVELNNLSIRIPQIEESVEECCEDTLTLARALWRLKAPSDIATTEPLPAIAEPQAEQVSPASDRPRIELQEESTEWRNLATAELLAGIKGLGKKKLDSVCELAPTVGDLEDLRGEGSKQFKQFHEMLPQGCGQGVASMIEDRLTEHVRKHSRLATGGNPLADELLNSLRQKAATDAWRASDCVPDSDDTEQTHLGYAAFNEGKPHSALPTQNPDLARQWMLGWVCAEIVKHSPPADTSEAAEQAKAQSAESKPDEPLSNTSVTTKGKKPRKPRATKNKS